MDEEVTASYLKRSLDEEWRRNFEEYAEVAEAFQAARCGSRHATLLLKLMRNLCVRNARAQTFWRDAGALDIAMASTRMGDDEFQKAVLTFVHNMLAGEGEENRAALSEYFPWAFVRWTLLDVNMGFMMLHSMRSRAEVLLRGHPAFLHLFFSLLAASNSESEFASIFLTSRSGFVGEAIMIIQKLSDHAATSPLGDAPEDLREALAKKMSGAATTLRFLWCACDLLSLDISRDAILSTLDAALPSVDLAPSGTAAAPIWWGDFLRLAVARTVKGDEAEIFQEQNAPLISMLLTRALPWMQTLLTIRPKDATEYVRQAQQWEVLNLLRLIANCLAVPRAKDMLDDSGNIWMLLNHTFSDPDLPMLMEVGLFALNNATRNHVRNQERVHALTQGANCGPVHMPSEVRAMLEGNKLTRVE